MGAMRMADGMATDAGADGAADDAAPAAPTLVPLPSMAQPLPEFAVFYRRELPQLVALATAIAGSSHAEEVAQEALLRTHRDWARVSGLDKPGAWTRRVAINLATSSRRRTSVEARALARVARRRTFDVPPPDVDGFWALVRLLPPKQAAAVALHYLEDRSLVDIAATLDCTEGTAKAHLHKARRTLASRLSTQEPDR
jgi:RNA polymerase sigma-70 factor (ECF subfamily)